MATYVVARTRSLTARNFTQVVWTDLAGVDHYRRADHRLRTGLPTELGMRRIGYQHDGGPLHREHYSSTMGRHLWCESGLEELAMLLADRNPSVETYACQALEFVWPLNSAHTSHVVDLVCRHSDGSVDLVDSHPKIDEKFRSQAVLTQAACEMIGWNYHVFTGLSHDAERNVRWLAADRHWWIVAGREALLERIVSAVTEPMSIERLCALVCPDAPGCARPLVHFAIWHGLVQVDWSRLVRRQTMVGTAARLGDI
ncbi:TnsA-like heteromeric transposase endonuclease subunit [Gordonia sp. VNK21]|uniref:TnsA-like heteromeric transposase endonuclease subunit n=1 Tax=Gordonia sp. VNK21 TaxID=3382483 RepID=UPI0038D4E347